MKLDKKFLEDGYHPYAVYNPHNKPVDDLPVIFGFNNGGEYGWMHACLLSEDGAGLGSHLCSAEYYMRGDLGIYEGSREDRHEGFRHYYPDGYRMAFVSKEDINSCEALLNAYKLNQEQAKQANVNT